ncbi:hypothetical protein BJ993_004098 [Nocardioides aromaticivorans]|uniref:Condensation domain-containing protein n=1 Tax=Nocardioides aromaticivorans TaxID=200618 RepID=A0A7Y9ZMH2_9ACTN|nr:hypothetical protein [Nocardioides aromaticivorans]NYI47018.1 hypothetical protein [Nocardioides aromaticivorans]
MTGWVADPGIGWRILLTARLAEPPDRADVGDRLAAITAAQEWPAPPPLRVREDLGALQRELVDADPAPLLVGVSGRHLVLSAHHSAVDGLGLLTLLERLGAGPVRSGARGVGARTTTGGAARTTTRRLREALLHPPARVTPPPGRVTGTGDVLVERTLPGTHRTAALVDAATRAVVAHERAWGRSATHVAIAVGAVRDQPTGAGAPVADRSVLLRLTDVEQLDAEGIAAALASAPVQTPPAGGGNPLLARAAAAGLRALAPRLGSTLLVSHLGEVTAPGVRALSFHPVTAGGTGLSLGAVGHDGTTTLTLRGRASSWNDNGLEQLLEAVVSLL